MVTAFMYMLLRNLKLNVMEMHSRKPQLYRTRVSDEFRESKSVVLVTSDVSSRGVNYPDVTLVVRTSLPHICSVLSVSKMPLEIYSSTSRCSLCSPAPLVFALRDFAGFCWWWEFPTIGSNTSIVLEGQVAKAKMARASFCLRLGRSTSWTR